MKVRIRSAAPTFAVDDVHATARWYADNLGFETVGHFPEHAPWAYASMQRDGAELILLNLAGYRKPDLTSLRPAGLWDAYIRLAGVRELFESVSDRPFIKTPLAKQTYGDWEFEVLDPNGYVLVFGGDEELP